MKNKKTVLVVLLFLTIGFTSLGQTSEVIVVDAPYKWIKGYGWTPETIVTLNIMDETMTQMYSDIGTVDDGEVLFDLRGDDQGNALFDLQPHHIVELSYGEIRKQISIENLEVTSVDLESDTVSGISDPYAYVNVKISGIQEIQVQANSDGFWSADFNAIADLQFGSEGVAYREDNDGDWSQAGWAINPWLWLGVNFNYGQSAGWLLGSSITVIVDDPTTEEQPDYIGGPFQVFPDPFWLNATVATYHIEGFDVRGGHILTITDGKYTKQLLVHDIQVTSIDFLNDTISGTTDRGNEICGSFGVEGFWSDDFICTSVVDGNWTIDCKVDDVDIEPGTLASFQQQDEDGDRTELGFYLSPTSEINIDDILKDFDESVEDQTLEGSGEGNSANGRLNALRNMLEMAGVLIDNGNIEDACGQLKAVLSKCDGDSPPPDFVTGSAATELYDMILELMEYLECE